MPASPTLAPERTKFQFNLSYLRAGSLYRKVCDALVLGIGGEDGQLGCETTVLHFERRLDHVGDILGPQFRRIVLLCQARSREEVRNDLARVN